MATISSAAHGRATCDCARRNVHPLEDVMSRGQKRGECAAKALKTPMLGLEP